MKIATLLASLALAFAAGCGDDGGKGKVDAPLADAPPAGTDAACFDNPHTYEEIINACTTAQKIYKPSHPPLLNPDGTLPALPP